MRIFDNTLHFRKLDASTIKEILKYRNSDPDSQLLVQLDNTQGMTSDSLYVFDKGIHFRIAGGYTALRIQKFSKYRPNNGQDYYDDVIYSRNEMIKILEAIEDIEKGIKANWTPLQKLIYVYDKLKSSIMYDPKFESRPSKEIRSLRGLITKQTVCAGYSLILKEILERQGIRCHYVESLKHAWNIVEIDGNLYPIDLTYDNRRFRDGKSNTHDFLGQSVEDFSKKHKPLPEEPIQDYPKRLSSIDPRLIKQISNEFNRSKEFVSTTYYSKREDGSTFIIAQVGDANIKGVNYYRYLYADVGPDNKPGKPLLLYSETNVAHYMNDRRFGRSTPFGYERAVDNVLFSRENILDSLRRRSFYIGRVRVPGFFDDLELVEKVEDIPKPKEKLELFTYSSKGFTRSDGTHFICQKMLDEPKYICGSEVMRYDIFEIVESEGRNIVKKNSVFTERDFYLDSRIEIVDSYLSRSRLDKMMDETGGYLGYLDSNGQPVYNPDLVKIFTTDKSIGEYISNLPVYQIPTFEELQNLAEKYEIYIDSDDLFDTDPNKIKIRDIKTKEVINDPRIFSKAMLANIWLTSAGVKWISGESRTGIMYAFNNYSKDLYTRFCAICLKEVIATGSVNSLLLFMNAEQADNTKDMEIIVNLFRTPYQTDFINNFFRNAAMTNKPIKNYPDVLYTLSYAGQLAYSKKYQEPQSSPKK